MKIKYGDFSVTYPKGFYAAATGAGLKDDSPDMALIYSKTPCAAAAVFTRNQVKAAPVIYNSEIMTAPDKRAILVNTASANACTGELGYENARASAEYTAADLGIRPEEVFVNSTGVIGVQLDMEKISRGIKSLTSSLKDSEEAGREAARAILTTDTVIKTASAEFEIDGKTVKIGGICKGAGMIRPDMATMLSFVTTDVKISDNILSQMLQDIAEDTYNMISVDGDMSTNDTAIVLANGEAENDEIISLDSDSAKIFYEALYGVEERLSRQIIKDAEGATKLIEVELRGAADKSSARTLARSVAESTLVKTAFFGNDPNWGRILAALGSSGADFDEKKAELYLKVGDKKIPLFLKGTPCDFDEKEASLLIDSPEITIEINLNEGDNSATAWGCDLSYEYVKINGEYRT